MQGLKPKTPHHGFKPRGLRRAKALFVGNGEVIENYPHAFPFPAKLLLGRCSGRAIHVVAAEDRSKQLVIVITAYEPTLDKWEPDMKTRRKHS